MTSDSDAKATILCIYLFGSLHVERASDDALSQRTGQPIRLSTRKIEALLAFLVLHPTAHAREKLAALFWGDVTDAQARVSLRTALANLRKQLGDDLFDADRETLQLNPKVPLWVDVLAFKKIADASLKLSTWTLSDITKLQSAMALYQGDLLADQYEDWLMPLREQYRANYLKLLLRLIQYQRTQGNYTQAIDTAHKLLAIEASHEQAHQHLMFCYMLSDQRERALQQYERCRHVLRDELGVEPSAETKRLYQWIRQTAHETKSLPAMQTNLPAPLSSFVGREPLVAALAKRLRQPETRLLTLTGAGGGGKTRLAIQVATHVAGSFKDGVWWVELAALTDGEAVAQTAAKACGVREAPEGELMQILVNFLRAKQVLLVLDNCEHLIRACAQFAQRLLQGCPQAQVMATSREALGLSGEIVWVVPPLQLGDGPAAPSEAVQLFVARAQALNPAFALTTQNASPVAQICERLDGLPLAIELAAARVNALTVEQIAARLTDRFDLLKAGRATALAHHQTLRAALDWSYDLLTLEEQRGLRSLAVFAGGFTLEAAEALWQMKTQSPQTSTLDVLARLVDKSLVVFEAHDETPRYHWLETIRQYAADKLWLSGEEHVWRELHLRWCVALAERAEPELLGAEQGVWQARLEVEYSNLRTALRWASESAQLDVAQLGLRLGGALWRFWDQHGYAAESRRQLTELLSQTVAMTQTEARAKALLSAGILAHFQVERDAAETLLDESLTIGRAIGNQRHCALALHHLGFAAHRMGDLVEARKRYEASLALWRECGDVWGLSETLSNLGMLARRENHLAQARAAYEESLAIKRRLKDGRGIAFGVWGLGHVAAAQGQYAEARAAHGEALALAWVQKDLWTLPYCLEGLAYVAIAESRNERAAMLFGATEALRARTAAPLPAVWRADYEHAVSAGQTQMGAAAFAAARARGREMQLEQVVALALQ